jgi:putative ABC transport system permease protein
MLRDLLSDVRYRIRALFRRAETERDLDDELRFHLEHQAARYMSDGVAPGEAMRRARITLGGVDQVKEQSRDVRGVRFLEQLVRDLLQSLRLIRKQPGFAALVVLSLALGLGATTAVFNLTYNVLFAPLAVVHPEQLITLERVGDDGSGDTFTWAEYSALREAPGVGTLVAARSASAISIGAGEAPAYVNMYFVEGSFFPMLGIRPRQGRLIGPGDDAGQAAVAVISERFAGHLFGAGAPAVGRTITIRGTPFTVIGVTPRSFRGLDFPGDFTAAIPLGAVPLLAQGGAGRDDHGVRYGLEDDRRGDARAFVIVGRREGKAEPARSALALAFERCCANVRAGVHERLNVIDIRNGIPAGKNDFRGGARIILASLLAGMALVLVVVCCNITSLLLVRASARQREIAVRLALGASRRRLVGQLVIESLPLAALGGAMGLVVAAWITAVFAHSLPADWADYLSEVFRFRSGPAVLGFAVTTTVACGLAFAVYPALRATRQYLAQSLRLDARASRTRGQSTVARGAVVGQIAFTVVLVTAASLLAATLRNLARVDGGFATDHMLLVGIETRSTPFERGGVGPISADVMSRVRAVPAVRAAGMATKVPIFGGSNTSLEIEVPGVAASGDKLPSVPMVASTPGHLATVGIRLIGGRDFTAADVAGAEPVVIVNAALVHRYFEDRDPVGRTIGIALLSDRPTPARIVGIAGDAKYSDMRSPAGPLLYAPLAQSGGPWVNMVLVVRSEGDPTGTARAVTRAIDAAAPGIQIRRVRDMRTQLADVMVVERVAARLAMFVSVMALLLSAVGLYGVVSYSVARRTSEIGVRLALGARARAVLWLVAKETLVLVVVGVVLGLPLAFAANGVIGAQLFGVSARDPAAAAVSIVLLGVVGVLASVVPAGRAARIHPRIALNAD